MAVKKSTAIQAKKPANTGKKLPGRPKKDLAEMSVNPDTDNMNEAENVQQKPQTLADKINFNPQEIAKALNDADTAIKSDNSLQDIIDKIDVAIKPIQDMKNEMKEINERQTEISKELQEHPEQAQEIVSKEIQKAEALKDKLEKALEKVKPQIKAPTAFPTQWWNGVKIS